MSPITDVDETGSAPISVNPGSMIDTDELDHSQKRERHPFADYCDQVRETCGIAPSQAAREVVSAICNAVAKLTIVDEDTLDEQAGHIAKLIAKDREDLGDKQLWTGPATKIAALALKLRAEGKGVVADAAALEPAVAGASST